MSKFSLAGIAGLTLLAAAPAFAADLPVEMPVKATFAQRFTWTGCYIGMHAGGAWKDNTVTDPVLLVQDNVNLGGPGFTTGPTTADVNEKGIVCDKNGDVYNGTNVAYPKCRHQWTCVRLRWRFCRAP